MNGVLRESGLTLMIRSAWKVLESMVDVARAWEGGFEGGD